MEKLKRCAWVNENDTLYREYHDKEWGAKVHNDRVLFEFLILEGAQAGLSWKTILLKRENYRNAFKGFDPKIISSFSDKEIKILLENNGIVRNELKIRSAIQNARSFLKVQDEFGSFDRYIWEFDERFPITNRWKNINEIPTRTPESDRLSKDLNARGFKFTGTKIVYSFLQAVGLVNDHTVDCFRYAELIR